MSVPVNNMTDTWNNAGTTYTAIKMNITDTASAAASLLMDLQIGGVSILSCDKFGTFMLGGTGANKINITGNSVGGTSTGNGCLITLGYNQTGNKQFWMGDKDFISD